MLRRLDASAPTRLLTNEKRLVARNTNYKPLNGEPGELKRNRTWKKQKKYGWMENW